MKKIYLKMFKDHEAVGFYNPPYAVMWKRKKVILACGTGDYVSMWSDKGNLYVLSKSPSMGYAGLEHFSNDGQDTGVVGECFFQNVSEELNHDLKKDFFDYSEASQLKILMQYI
jgi:hypothetical protein